MRLCFVLINANVREGTSRAVVEVARRLAEDHEVTVLCRSNEIAYESKMRYLQLWAPSWPDVAEFAVFRWKAEHWLRRSNFDIIHSAGCNVSGADVYAVQTVHPVKMEVNNKIGRSKSVGPLRRVTRDLYDQQVLRAESISYREKSVRGIVGFLPVSLVTKAELISTYPVSNALVEIIPNGADLDTFSPDVHDRTRTDIRKELGIKDSQCAFLFAGGEWKRKGLNFVIDAMGLLLDRDIVLCVAGSDPEAQYFKSVAAESGIGERIRWLGFRADIQRIYSACDAFVFPSAYEAFSLATIEASAAGLAVIMCETGGARELLGDGEAGFIVERSSRSIASAMLNIESSPELRKAMGLHGRAKVEELFNWDRIARRTESFYYHLLETRKKLANDE